MKAVQVLEPGKINIIERDMPTLERETDVIVKTKAAGICGSDIHIYHGTNAVATYPRVIGHEAVGEVYQVGEAVTNVKVGDRVILEPIEYCGECYACRLGRPNVCEKLKVRGVHSDGGFQEYFIAQSDKLHILGSDIEFTDAVMIEPFSIGAQVCFRGQIAKGEVVLIYGAGPTGLAVLENAKHIGATCIVLDMNENRLAYAKTFGADYTFNPSKVDIKAEVEALTGGMLANVVVDAVGSTKVMADAVYLTSVAGRIVSMGFLDQKAEISMLEVTKKEISIVGSRLQTYQFEKCIEYFKHNEVHLTDLITHKFHFEDVKEAVALIENEPEKVGKIILTF
ncbi:MAG: zinc-binding alcohol dehydrogenase family protein [Clostridia bacterium]|nr:zinc-binding alcohol dehydrogenase family protein [Clostridia bacterium]